MERPMQCDNQLVLSHSTAVDSFNALSSSHWSTPPRTHLLRRALVASLLTCIVTQLGCKHFFPGTGRPPQVEVPISNPFQVGLADPSLVWQQVVDAVDDYFRIKSETPVRRDSAAWLEGRLETFPEVAGTLFEPWRRDSTPGFERVQSTFQTIRRTAYVKVLPGPDGYLIDVKVVKEQEDVDHSQYPTAGSSVQRHDGTVVRNASVLTDIPTTIDWYPAGIGRDLDLERRLAESIAGRLTNIEAPQSNGWLAH
jgi:hypothetical protein